MFDFLSARVTSSPQALALITPEGTWTYSELNAMVAEMCASLVYLGIQRGQIVALLLPNSIEYVVLIHALLRLGVTILPLNTRLTASELDYQLRLTACQWVFCGRETQLIASELVAPMRHLVSLSTTSDPTFERLSKSDNTMAYERGTVDLEALCAIVFTSGTSGQPKGAMLSVGNFFYSALASAYHLGTLPDDRWLCVLPLFHVGGLSIIIRACLYGISVDLHAKFDAEFINQYLTQMPVTLLSLVPTQLHRLLERKAKRQAPRKLRMILLGGASASSDLLARAQSAGLPVAITYGLTEATSQVATASPLHAARKIGTVGKPLPFTQVQIVDKAGNPVPSNTYGEVIVRGQTVMRGYYNHPEATAKTLRNGALYTGDIGYFDAEGDLWIVQRRSDLIISGGENIYPTEVENVLLRHPAVKEACVVGIADTEWGQRVVCALVTTQPITTQELYEFVQGKLARYKQPREWRIVEALPVTASGKVIRSAVVALFQENTP